MTDPRMASNLRSGADVAATLLKSQGVEYAIARTDFVFFEFASKLKSGGSQTCVGPSRGSQSTPVRNSSLFAMRDTVIEKTQQRRPLAASFDRIYRIFQDYLVHLRQIM